MTRWIADLFGTRSRTPIRRKALTRLGVEALECRTVPTTLLGSLDPSVFQLYVSDPYSPGTALKPNGDLLIQGTDKDDVVTVALENGQLKVTHQYMTTYSPGLGTVIEIAHTVVSPPFNPAQVTRVVFLGDDGNDEFANSTAEPTAAYGMDGDDLLSGGTAADYLGGGGGDDELYGGSGHDTLSGGAEYDRLEGQGGDDHLKGGTGGDTYVFAGTWLGSDTLTEAAAAGTDTLDFSGLVAGVTINLASTAPHASGAALTLTLATAGTVENVTGSPKADVVTGNGLVNVLKGGGGADQISGGGGHDTLVGGDGDDTLKGEDGNDQIEGQGGNDTLWGNAGDDTFVFGSYTGGYALGADTIWEGIGDDGDTLDFGKLWGPIDLGVGLVTQQTYYAGSGPGFPACVLTLTNAGGIDKVIGTGYGDVIAGSNGDNTLIGGLGDDVLIGHGGADVLAGGLDRDKLYGGGGTDTLDGGSEADLLVSIGGGTNDVLTGGTGTDSFWLDAESTEVITDADAAESAVSLNVGALQRIHRVGGFMTYAYGPAGGFQTVPVSRELTGQELSDPIAASSYMYQDFADNPLFAANGPSADDVFQGDVGDCYFMATLAGIARTDPDRIREMVTDLGDGTYAVHFHKNDVINSDVFVRVDADLPALGDGSPAYAKLGPGGALWVAVVEKAWAFYRNMQGTYESIAFVSNPGIGIADAFNVSEVETYNQWPTFLTATSYLTAIKWALGSGKVVTLSGPGGLTAGTAMTSDNYHSSEHRYTVCKVNTDSNGNPVSVVLRNPYGGYQTIGADLLFHCSKRFQAYSV